jgi:hypothetical protein
LPLHNWLPPHLWLPLHPWLPLRRSRRRFLVVAWVVTY